VSDNTAVVPEPASPTARRQRWYVPRTARARTLSLGGLLTGALLLVATTVPVPFVALGPGSTYNTIAAGQGREVISFSGDDIPAAAAEQPTGHLNMLTIRVVDRVPLIESAIMWASGTYKFAPRDEYYPPDKTKQEVTEANVKMFRESQSAAEIEALRHLG
jgi:PDZ domain-containing protein